VAKLITVRCYDPIAVDKTYRQPWSDLWISFTSKPGRRRYAFAPTLVSLPALKQDLQMALDVNDAAEAADCERIMQLLNEDDGLDIERGANEDQPTIYTSREYIDRAEAQRMISYFLGTLGYANCRFKWLRPKIVLIPVLV
jgi:hypothetical protein